jgi:uncharacterized Fe-S cluster protein YjdI
MTIISYSIYALLHFFIKKNRSMNIYFALNKCYHIRSCIYLNNKNN